MYRLAILNSHPIQYFAPLYRRLAQEPDIDLTVYFGDDWGTKASFDPGFGQEIVWDVPLTEGYKHKFLPNWRRNGSINQGFWGLLNFSIFNELRRGQYDALIVHGYAYATHLFALLAARLLGIPVFLRGETHLELRRSASWERIRPTLMRIFLKQYQRFLAIGTKNKAYYLFHGIPPQHIFLVPYTVDNTFFAQQTERAADTAWIYQQWHIPTGKTVILFVSKLIDRKRPLDLIKAYQTMPSRAEVVLLIVGSGPLEDGLKTYVAEQQLEEVYFCGFQNQTAIPYFFRTADIFVLPSENEPWGLIINEAMNAGLPIIAAEEIGATADLIESGRNGFTYPAGDVPQLAHHLQQLVDNPLLRQQMGVQSQQIISAWDYDQCVVGIKQALNSLQENQS